MQEKVLGIDVGGNSIGWALIATDDQSQDFQLLQGGICAFLSAEERGEAKNKDRRDKRLARRQTYRRVTRREILCRTLVHAGLLPVNERERRELLKDGEDRNSYALRTRALNEKLNPYEIGRILMHLVRRRGFLSSRKQNLGELARDPEIQKIIERLEEEEAELSPTTPQKRKREKQQATQTDAQSREEEDESTTLRKGKELQKEMEEAGARTLGEYFYQLLQQGKPIRRRTTLRSMYEDEFDAIWQKQQEYYPNLLTQELKERVRYILFFQRPLKLDPDRLGQCSYEPEEHRAYLALPTIQRWRIWQDLNNLTHRQKDLHDETPLTYEQKSLLFEALEHNQKLTWAQVRKLLSIPRDRIFNLEEEKGKKGKELTGNITSIALRKALGEKWDNLPPEKQDELVQLLVTEQRRRVLYETLQTPEWGFTKEEAIKAISTPLKSGTASVSLTVARKTLPHLKAKEYCPRTVQPDGSEKGCDREGHLWHHALELAGYTFREESPTTGVDKLPLPPEVRNPVVQKALFQLRKVVNAIVKEYGKPNRIRIEFARDLQTSQAKRERIIREQQENERKNREAREKLIKEFGISRPSRDDVIKLRLWEEYPYCPYTGTFISQDMLFSEQVDVEHILPFSRTLDDSYMNKTLCLAEENRNVKHKKTPYEAYGSDEERWKRILKNIENLPKPKQQRFKMTELPEEFYNRQLNDTRYIAKASREYLKQLGVPVEPTKGSVTAILRDAWGLNALLRDVVKEDLGEIPSQEGETETLNTEEETEGETLTPDTPTKLRDDHRHHFVDAFVVALTSPALIKRISDHARTSDIPGKRAPYKGAASIPQKLREELRQTLKKIVVAHAPRRKIEGAFHDETAYGMRDQTGKRTHAYQDTKEGQDVKYVVRKPVDGLTPPEIARIIDGGIRERIIQRILQLVPEGEKESVRSAIEKYQKEGRPKIPQNTKKAIEEAIKKLKPPTPHDPETANLGVIDHTGKYIRRVRVEARIQEPKTLPVKDAQGRVYKVYFITGQYHHVEIFECTEDHEDPISKEKWEKGDRRGYFVSQLEAAERARRLKEPLVKRTPPKDWGPHWKFVMSLHKNDMVELNKRKRKGIFRVQQLEPSNNRVVLRLHTSANTKDNRTREFLQISQSHSARKISVDPIGRIHPAGD